MLVGVVRIQEGFGVADACPTSESHYSVYHLYASGELDTGKLTCDAVNDVEVPIVGWEHDVQALVSINKTSQHHLQKEALSVRETGHMLNLKNQHYHPGCLLSAHERP